MHVNIMTRCADCPTPEAIACIGGWYCRLATGSAMDRQAVIARSEIAAGLEPSTIDPALVPEMARAETAPPSGPVRAVRFLRALIAHARDGFRTLPVERSEARLVVCRACPEFNAGACKLCGCNMALKATWADQECPLKKWPT